MEFYVYREVNSNPEAGEYAAKKGVAAIPTTVLVSSDGTEQQRIIGSVPESEFRAAIERVLE